MTRQTINRQDLLTGEKSFSLVADSPSNIVLGERRKGFFSVIVPTEETINYIENPSFMAGEYPYDSIGYDGSRGTMYGYTEINCNGTRATEYTPEVYPMYGGWVYISPEDREEASIFYSAILTRGKYTFSCFVSGDRASKFSIYIADFEGNRLSSKKTIRGNGNWQRVHLTFDVDVSQDVYNLYLTREATNSDAGFYTSFWMCEDNGYLTLPFNGNSKEKSNSIEKLEVYSWLGGEWTSKSKRTEFACNSGKEFYLRDYGFVLSSIAGLGSSGIQHITQDVSSFGSVWNTTKISSREFTLKGHIQGKTLEERMQNERNLETILSSTNRINPEQPTALLFRVMNEDDNSIIEGQTLYIYCRYNGGVGSDIQNENGNYPVNLSFTLADPFIYSSMHKGYYLDNKIVFDNSSEFAVYTKDESNNWDQLDIRPDGRIDKIIRGKNGKIYIGGVFTNINGVIGTKYFAEYNEQTNEVSSVGIFEDSINSETFVSEIITLANGNILVFGSFASVDGLGSTNNIAMYNPSKDIWSPVAGGFPNTRMMIYSAAISQSGVVYVTGTQDDGGANYIYRCYLFGRLGYIGSSKWIRFAELNGGVIVPVNMISGRKLLIVNRKFDIDFAGHDLYVTGRFDSVDSTVDTGGLAKYNGWTQSWESLGDEILSYTSFDLHADDENDSYGGVAEDDNLITENGDNIVAISPGGFVEDMELGKDGKIYMVGGFAGTTSGILSPFIIRYNGSSFEPIGLPGNYASFVTSAREIEIDNLGNVHILVDFSFTDYIPLARVYLVLTGNIWKSGGIYTDGEGARVSGDGTIYYDKVGNKIWLAIRTENGNVTFGGDNILVENLGESIYPDITFAGGGQIVSLSNKATGKMIDFSSYTLQDKEIVKLNLQNYGIEVVELQSNINGNITNMISRSSNMSFNLVRGINKIGYIFNDEDIDSSCFAVWRERYLGLFDSMNFRDLERATVIEEPVATITKVYYGDYAYGDFTYGFIES